MGKRKTGEHLRIVRRLAGLTQVELAQRLDIWQSQVAEYEAGKHEPRADLYRRWLEVCKGGDFDTAPESIVS